MRVLQMQTGWAPGHVVIRGEVLLNISIRHKQYGTRIEFNIIYNNTYIVRIK